MFNMSRSKFVSLTPFEKFEVNFGGACKEGERFRGFSNLISCHVSSRYKNKLFSILLLFDKQGN